MICPEGEVDPSHYVDPIGKRVLGFDHIKQVLQAIYQGNCVCMSLLSCFSVQQVIPGDVADLPADWNTSFENER